MKRIGIVLIVVGVFALGYTFTVKEKVLDLGPIEVVKEKQYSLNWPPVAGCILILCGVGLILSNKKGGIFN